MTPINQYHQLCGEISELITHRYSTSFTKGIKLLHRSIHKEIYSIYGFVRLTDEIVDTFHNHDKKALLDQLKEQTWQAINEKISTNPVLHAFQITYHKFQFTPDLVEAFFRSMEMDLTQSRYDDLLYNEYIYGSAEVVGLMCLHVFTDKNKELYNQLIKPAKRLGAAFQKVNFLRDLKSDFAERGRTYFPKVDFTRFSNEDKQNIESDIDADFKAAYPAIDILPEKVQPGVYTAFIYYRELFYKIQKTPASRIQQTRIRVPDWHKLILLGRTYIRYPSRILSW
ncbi:MAG: phytoene/squalene synthase family protein [Bacteroidia bacterium]|nr:phytoene/squalene synthase family protein [Bacteroidia bacterium]